MMIAVIGAGNMGGGLARLLAPKHEVAIGSRDKEKGAARAKELGVKSGGSYADAAAEADVVFLTVPWVAVDETLAELGNLAGKVLIDVTNPYVGGKLQLHESSSDAEEIQRKVPKARVVKGWNTIFAPVLNSSPDFGGQAGSVFLAGDDDGAKQIVATLARDNGLRPGGLRAAERRPRPGGNHGAPRDGRPQLRVRELDPQGPSPLTERDRLRVECSHHSTETGYRASIRSPVTRERSSATA